MRRLPSQPPCVPTHRRARDRCGGGYTRRRVRSRTRRGSRLRRPACMPWSPAVSCAGIRCRPGAVLTPETGRAVRPLAPRSPGVARRCQAPLVAKLLPDGRYSRPTDNLTQQKTPHERGFLWSGRRGSNPRPSAWEADALPTELRPRWPQDSASDFRSGKERYVRGRSRALPERSPGAGCGTAHLRRGFMGEPGFPHAR